MVALRGHGLSVRDRIGSDREEAVFSLRFRRPGVVLGAFWFPAADDAPTAQAAEAGGHDGPLAVAVVVVTVDDDPVMRRPQLVGPGGVGIQGGVVPVAA